MENPANNNQGVPGSVVEPGKELATAQSNPRSITIGDYYDSQTWGVMKMMAQTFIDAQAFPDQIKNVPQAMIRLQAGRELGMKPVESLKYIALVNGSPSLWGDKAIEMVVAAGHEVEWIDCDAKSATVKITRADTGKSMKTTFTMEMAIERGLNKTRAGELKDTWKKSPENMLKFKAFHMTAKFIVPDALRGCGLAEVEQDEIEVGPGMFVAPTPATGPKTVVVAERPTTETPVDAKPIAKKLGRKSLADRMAERNETTATPEKEQEPEKPKAIEGEVAETEPAEVVPAQPAPKEESPAVRKMKAVAEAAKQAVENEPLPDPRDANAEFAYKRLIDKELSGGQLTQDELTFTHKYLATLKK